MAEVTKVEEQETLRIAVKHNDATFIVEFSFLSDNVKDAEMKVYVDTKEGEGPVRMIPAAVARAALQAFAESKVEFAEG